MKKILFFIYLMLFACVFANAQTVSQQLEKAKANYLFGNGVYTVGAGAEQEYQVNYWDEVTELNIPLGTVAIIKIQTFPIEAKDVGDYILSDNTCERLSDEEYCVRIKYTAENITENDYIGLSDEVDFNVTAIKINVTAPQKKDFTVKANGSKIDPEQILDFSVSDTYSIQVYDNDTLIPGTGYYIPPAEITEGNLAVNKSSGMQATTVSYVSGSGTAKLTITKEGYNDFVFYAEYPEPADSVKIFKGETDVTGQTLEMNVLDFATFTAEVESETLSEKVTWSTDNWNVARVINGVVTGKKEGTVTITATSKANPELSASITVTVEK